MQSLRPFVLWVPQAASRHGGSLGRVLALTGATLVAACSGAQPASETAAQGGAGGQSGAAGQSGAGGTVGGSAGSQGGSGGAQGGAGGAEGGSGGAQGGAGAQGGSAGTLGAAAIRFIGRVDSSDAMGARFAWSGSGFVARFNGASASIQLGGGQQYTVVVDGRVQPKLISTGGPDPLAEGLAPGEHTVELYRRTEADQGESVFLGLDLGSGELLAPPPLPERRIEIIGDSITCGYGNEGADMNCPFTPDTENHYLTYGAIAARELGAELSTVAWSGKGVVCNYGDDATSCQNPLPTYYERTLPNQAASQWDFSSWQPQAIVVNLGTNDFSTDLDPSPAEFEAGYLSLLEQVRAVNPDATILCTVGPLLSGSDLASARMGIQNAVNARVAAGDSKVKAFELAQTNAANGYGCDWHPSLLTHEAMASELTAALRAELGW